MTVSGNTTQKVDAGTAFQNWISSKLAYLKLGFASLLSVLGAVEEEAVKLLDLAEEDAPKLTGLLATFANIATTLLPGGALGAYLIEAAAIIVKAEPWVKTAQGVLMSASEATGIGLKSTTPVGPTEAVTAAMASAYPDVPAALHAQLIPVVQAAVAQGVTAVAPTVIGPTPTAAS